MNNFILYVDRQRMDDTVFLGRLHWLLQSRCGLCPSRVQISVMCEQIRHCAKALLHSGTESNIASQQMPILGNIVRICMGLFLEICKDV